MGMDTHVRHAKVEDVEAFVVALSGERCRQYSADGTAACCGG